MRVFAALGTLECPSYRPSKFACEKRTHSRSFHVRATARGSQMPVRNFFDRLPGNAVLKTCKTFKVIHAFAARIFCVSAVLRPADSPPSPAPATLKIAVSETCKTFRTIYVPCRKTDLTFWHGVGGITISV
jgi:hypothetical protein